MSYILDALRKSDLQRRRGTAPMLLAAPAPAAPPRQPALLLYSLFAVGLLGAGVAIGWLRPWQAEEPRAVIQPTAAKPVDTAAPPPAPTLARTNTPEQQVNTRKPPSPRPGIPAPADPVPKAPGPGQTLAAAGLANATDPSAALPMQAAQPASDRPGGARLPEPPQARELMTIAELPASILQQMPKMSISVHAYSSNPKERLVGINDRMLREGDSVEPGMVLEQITPDGMILTYRGYRFLRGVR